MKAVLFLSLFLLAFPASAQTIEEGIEKYEAQQFKEAFKILKPYADTDDLEAQKYIAFMYWNGIGVEKDLSKGCDYFEKASIDNDPEAVSYWGLCYAGGFGREENWEKTYSLLKKGYEAGYRGKEDILGKAAYFSGHYDDAFHYLLPYAQQGNPNDMVMIGALYRDGKGVPQDHKVACDWFEKALPSKNVAALHNFGDCLYFGLDRPVDKKGAYPYFKEAADLGSEKSKSAAKAIFKELYEPKAK